MKRGLDTLREYKRLADMHGVDKLLAVAVEAPAAPRAARA
jgi:exopolyphosphatase/pppGpp-phosphohydrolase